MLISLYSCDSDKIQARLDSVLGLRRTISRDSIVSFAGSINTKKAYKKFCKGLFEIGVTAEMISQKEKEIQAIFKPHHSPCVDQGQLPEVGNSSDAETLPVSTENKPKARSRLGRVVPPIDFLVGPLMLAAAEAGNSKRSLSTLEYVRNTDFADDKNWTALHKAVAYGHSDIVQILLSNGASAEAMDSSKSTPLHLAAWN